MTDDSKKPVPEKIESAPEGCQTRPFIASFSECMSDKQPCKYSFGFGYVKLCKHPGHRDFWAEDNGTTPPPPAPLPTPDREPD